MKEINTGKLLDQFNIHTKEDYHFLTQRKKIIALERVKMQPYRGLKTSAGIFGALMDSQCSLLWRRILWAFGITSPIEEEEKVALYILDKL